MEITTPIIEIINITTETAETITTETTETTESVIITTKTTETTFHVIEVTNITIETPFITTETTETTTKYPIVTIETTPFIVINETTETTLHIIEVTNITIETPFITTETIETTTKYPIVTIEITPFIVTTETTTLHIIEVTNITIETPTPTETPETTIEYPTVLITTETTSSVLVEITTPIIELINVTTITPYITTKTIETTTELIVTTVEYPIIITTPTIMPWEITTPYPVIETVTTTVTPETTTEITEVTEYEEYEEYEEEETVSPDWEEYVEETTETTTKYPIVTIETTTFIVTTKTTETTTKYPVVTIETTESIITTPTPPIETTTKEVIKVEVTIPKIDVNITTPFIPIPEIVSTSPLFTTFTYTLAPTLEFTTESLPFEYEDNITDITFTPFIPPPTTKPIIITPLIITPIITLTTPIITLTTPTIMLVTPIITLTTPTITLTTPTITLTTPTITLTTPTITLTTPTITLTTPTITLTTPTITLTTPTITLTTPIITLTTSTIITPEKIIPKITPVPAIVEFTPITDDSQKHTRNLELMEQLERKLKEMDEKMKDIERKEIELDKEEEEWQNRKAKIISDLLQRQKMMKAYVATKAIEALHEITQTTIGEHAIDIDTTRPKMKMITLSPFLTTDAFEKRLRMLEIEFWEREKWIKELERRLLEREKRFKKDQEDFEKLVREMEETLKKGKEISWPPKTSEPTETIRDCCLRTTPLFSPLPPTERTTIDIREPTITPKKDTTIRTTITEEEKEIEKETVTKETVTEETVERLTPKRFVTTKKCVLRSKVVGKDMVTERVCVPYILSKEEEGKTKIATLHLEEHEWTEGPFVTDYMTPQTETEEYENENKESIEQNRIKRNIGKENAVCPNYQLYNFTNCYKITTRRIRYIRSKKDGNTKIVVLHLEEHEWTEGPFTTNYMTPQTEIEEVDREEIMERERFKPDIDEKKTVCPDYPLYKITDDKMKTTQTPSKDEEEKTKLFALRLKEHEWMEGPFTTDYVTPQTEIEENKNENKRSIERNRFKQNINEQNAVCPNYQLYNVTGYKMTTNHLLIDESFCKYANCNFQLTKSLTITEASRIKSTGKMNWKIDNNRYKVRSMLQIIEDEEVENDNETIMKQNEWNNGIYDYENQIERNLRQEEVTEPWENQDNDEYESKENDEYKEEETTVPKEEVIETPMIYTPEEEKPKPKKIHEDEEEEETTEEEKTRQPPGPEWPTEPLTNYHVGGTRTWTLEYPEEKPRKPEDEEEEDFKRVGKRPEKTTCYYVVLTKDKKRREIENMSKKWIYDFNDLNFMHLILVETCMWVFYCVEENSTSLTLTFNSHDKTPTA
ncbi:uncharacterized protein LOC102675979 [Apis dorsata]|uniref:uncharacterized protein LOC102675979 n=1 Tax=Apis dorsata TaxID=7462 RepID=UPI001292D4F2|nr:uncharacterized protein LOC102675979 [Apis dorsata]